MDIDDMTPHKALALVRERYINELRHLHHVVRHGGSPTVAHLETLERYRQLEEMQEERAMQELGLAPDPDQLDQLEAAQ